MGNNNIIYLDDLDRSNKKPSVQQIDSSYITVNQTSEKGAELRMNNHLFDEIKADMREREERTRNEIKEREERFEKQLSLMAAEAEKREERFINDNKEREQRMMAKIDTLDNRIQENSKHTETMKNQNFWGNIAMFVGLVAIIITLLNN
ncbi:hypothetical protein M3579_17235 [Bacillus pumilus]|uniref:hypothetical protein n=1 Tax=Bacillus pumilus TaxID=1408 RepID=UPI0020417A46|nr:hypothetical protein [Bacillus pumilus]MCM3037708.1 hypothetical protein [Bacillus pumilus]